MWAGPPTWATRRCTALAVLRTRRCGWKGVIEEFAPRAPDPDAERTYRRLMTSLGAAPDVLGWGEPAVLQARAAARVARAEWRLPVDAPAAAGYVDCPCRSCPGREPGEGGRDAGAAGAERQGGDRRSGVAGRGAVHEFWTCSGAAIPRPARRPGPDGPGAAGRSRASVRYPRLMMSVSLFAEPH